MVCYDILVQKKDISLESNITKRIQCKMQGLQNFSCPLELKLIIEECLFEKDPSKRPSFKNILESLMDIKKIVLEDQLTNIKHLNLWYLKHEIKNILYLIKTWNIYKILLIFFASLWRWILQIQNNKSNSRSIKFHTNVSFFYNS